MLRILVIILFFLAATSAPAQGNDGPLQPDPDFLARLSELDSAPDLAPLFQFASTPKTRAQLKAGLDWMQKRAFSSETRDPRYLMSYSYLSYMANIKDTAAFAYLSGLLLARVEAVRCADPSAPEPKLFQLEVETRFLAQTYWSFEPEKRQQMLTGALNSEDIKVRGKPSKWLCSGGLRDQLAVLEKAKNGEAPLNAKDIDMGKNTIGLIVDTSSVEPSFLPDEIFLLRRSRLRANFERHYSQLAPKKL